MRIFSSHHVLLAALCCVLAWFATEAGAEARNSHGVAVIVGNKDYRHPDIPAVSFAHRDADAFKRYAVDVLGFDLKNIIDLRDATRRGRSCFAPSGASKKGRATCGRNSSRTGSGTWWYSTRATGCRA